MSSTNLERIGKRIRAVQVRFSVRSLQLFSEGLYSSPHKAVEELFSNSYDAGARNVHIVLHDPNKKSGTITVIDDGVGMDADGIAQHWLIGESNKRDPDYVAPLGRAPIGKFGIGKLATYVLANKFHLVSKHKNKFYVATMDYEDMVKRGSGNNGKATVEREYKFWIRSLTASEARSSLSDLTTGDGEGYDAINLFGANAARSWTVAILSDLRPLAEHLRTGMLGWVLSTALPLRADFQLYLNGVKIEPSKLKVQAVKKWTIGDNYLPATAGIVKFTDPSRSIDDPRHVGIDHPALGRVSGSFTLYEDIISGGKSDRFTRSHGFFVYVRGRLLNEEDPYFGIPENSLRHGTFSRFRMDVYLDELDAEMRSSRETYLETSNVSAARDLLKACFSIARSHQAQADVDDDPEIRVVDRLSKSPRSVTTTPMLHLAQRASNGAITPKLTRLISADSSLPNASVADLSTRANDGNLFKSVELVTSLEAEDGICIFDATSGKLNVNMMHPFVAHFADEFDGKRAQMALELLATSEVLLEASLYENINDEAIVKDLLEQRDTLLRSLARSAANRSPSAVAQRLTDESVGWKQFELALVGAFDAMGFYAQHVSGPKRPDGIAEARLSAVEDGRRRAYRVSLEAKKYKKNVGKSDAEILSIAGHRDAYDCDHAIIVAKSFTDNEEHSLIEQLHKENESERLRFDALSVVEKRTRVKPRTLTLARVEDLAVLVRLVSYKRIKLDDLRRLFDQETPQEVHEYVADLRVKAPNRKYFRELLDTIAKLQLVKANAVIEYGTIQYALNTDLGIDLEKDDIREACHAMELLSNQMIFAQDKHVELNTRPELIVDAIMRSINEFPEGERPAVRAVLNGSDVERVPSRRLRR